MNRIKLWNACFLPFVDFEFSDEVVLKKICYSVMLSHVWDLLHLPIGLPCSHHEIEHEPIRK